MQCWNHENVKRTGNSDTNETISKETNAVHESLTDKTLEVDLACLQKRDNFSYNMKWETYFMTKFGNCYVSDMFKFIFTEPPHAPRRSYAKVSISKMLSRKGFTSNNFGFSSKIAARTLKNGAYCAVIIQINGFKEYCKLFYKDRFYVVSFSYTNMYLKNCTVVQTL